MIEPHDAGGSDLPQALLADARLEAPNPFDERTADLLRAFSQSLSRRSLISRLGRLMLGVLGVGVVAVLPLDPLIPEVAAAYTCSSWQLCGLCGRICTCCNGGGGLNVCPYGSTWSAYWSACCYSPSTGFGSRFFYWDCLNGNANCSGCLSCQNNCPQPLWGSGTYKCTAVTQNPSC